LGNTPKTKLNKYLASRAEPGPDPWLKPPNGCLLRPERGAKRAYPETWRSASSRVSFRRVKIIRLPTMANPTR